MKQRLFQPTGRKLGERDGSCVRRLRVAFPDDARVDQQFRRVSQPFSRVADERDIVCLAVLAHRTPTEFRRAEPAFAQAQRDLARLLRSVAEQDGGVGEFFVRLAFAEQPINRLIEVLTERVPNGDIRRGVGVVDLLNVHAVAYRRRVQSYHVVR